MIHENDLVVGEMYELLSYDNAQPKRAVITLSYYKGTKIISSRSVIWMDVGSMLIYLGEIKVYARNQISFNENPVDKPLPGIDHDLFYTKFLYKNYYVYLYSTTDFIEKNKVFDPCMALQKVRQ